MTSGTALILLCYDRSDGSRHAVNTTASLFPGSTVAILHVWQSTAVIAAAHAGAVWMPTYDESELQNTATEIAEEGAREAIAAGLDARPEVAQVTSHGIARTILDCADQRDARLIVLGARGLSTFKAVMLGSVSRSVAQQAHRPVLVVPPLTRSDMAMDPTRHEAGSPRYG